jgi:hypothetical protein
MAVPGEPYDAPLVPYVEHALAAAGGELATFDAHTHLGENDPDGGRATPEEIVAGLDRAGHERALIFPMQEPDGYRDANDAAIAGAARSGGRLVALARVAPGEGDAAVREAQRALAAGAVGFKLHPRSDAFDLPHPVVERIVALAAEARAPVLFHAGRGFPGLGEAAAELSRRHPDARLILAHAGISDLGHLGPIAAEAPNLFFDTSWWLVSDLLTLYATVPPGRILYASDMPYGAARFASLAFLRCALAVGLGRDALELIAGGQLERIVAGEDPVDCGPAPGMEILGMRDLIAERGIAYLAATCQILFRGGDATEPLALARLAFAPAPNAVVAAADALVAEAQAILARDPEDVVAARYPAIAAQLLLGTPSVGAPG